MKLPKLFSKKTKQSAPPKDVNPYAVYLSADPSTRPVNRASIASPVHVKSSNLELSPSVASTGYQKRPIIDQLFELENQQLIEAFKIIDTNGDGKISEQELGVMWQRLGKKISDKELRFMILEADLNGDGVIDLEEFVAFHKVLSLGIEDPEKHAEEIRVAFTVSDKDRDGLISAADMQKVMKRLGKRKATLDECSAMVRCVDSDGDSLITLPEFEKLMMSSIFARSH